MTPRVKCGLAGAVLLAVGPLLLKLEVFDVLDAARRHASTVSWSEKALFMIPIAFFGGIAALVCVAMPSVWVGDDPNRRRQAFSDLSSLHKVAVVTSVIVILGLSFGLRSWFLGELALLGYES